VAASALVVNRGTKALGEREMGRAVAEVRAIHETFLFIQRAEKMVAVATLDV